MEPVVVHTPDDLLAVVPHMLGFNPQESLVVVPISRGLPLARIDLPRTAQDRNQVLRTIQEPYGRNAGADAQVALVCVTEDRRSAELATRQLADGLEKVGVASALRLWASAEHWEDLNSGHSGNRTQDATSRMAAEAVVVGTAPPAANREALSDSLAGDRQPIAEVLPAAQQAAQSSTPAAERDWSVGRLGQFHADGARPSDTDAARLLVAIESIGTRDALWEDITQHNARSHSALWTDLTRRAPDEVRTPAASLLAFSSWLGGDGAKAWCALDQIPDGQPPYSMASLIATTLQAGINPKMWDEMRQTSSTGAAEAHDSPSPTHRHERDIPNGSQPPSRGGPAR